MTARTDRFSSQAGAYARHRPHYPGVLFDRLAELAPGRRRAWDCATGNGQAARGLAAHFRQLVATDASHAQLVHAHRSARIDYLVARAEATPFASDSIDLVTVAQAAHWFDLELFYAEVRRVLRTAGVVALWCYGLLRIDPLIDPLIDRYYHETVGPWWPAERRWVENGYRTLPFPFDELPGLPMQMKVRWRVNDCLGYLSSWSATQACRDATHADPLAPLRPALTRAWGEEERTVLWPLRLRLGRT